MAVSFGAEVLRWAEQAIARLRADLAARQAGPISLAIGPIPPAADPDPVPQSAVAVRVASVASVASAAPVSAAAVRDGWWQPREWSGRVGGFDLGTGMLYVGSGLAGLSRWRAPVEPALIDPRLPVARSHPDHQGAQMSYWPSYSTMPPACRAAYLAWLAGGRADPLAHIGYVFLYFYGIERRLLIDARRYPAATREVPLLVAEVRRLLALYGANRSFHGYASRFLRAVNILFEGVNPATLAPPLDATSANSWLDLKIGLGACAGRGAPLPGEWALAWMLALPEVSHRRAAERCSEDFRRLFLLRYHEAFAAGLQLEAGGARLTTQYVAASPTFDGPLPLALPDMPDVDVTAPPPLLRDLGNRVLDELAPYSRWIGRTGEGDSPAAVALLPHELTAAHDSAAGKSLLAWIAEQIAGPDRGVVELRDVAARWPAKSAGRFARGDAEALAAFLEARGYGVEPDARMAGFAPSRVHRLAFFQPGADSAGGGGRAGGDGATAAATAGVVTAAATAGSGAADALLHLAATVRDGAAPLLAHREHQLAASFAGSLGCSPAWLARLEARRLWLIANPPGPVEVRKRLAPLDSAQRGWLPRALVELVTAEGQPLPEHLPHLAKIYGLLGLPAAQVYSDVHARLSAGAAPAAAGALGAPAAPAADALAAGSSVAASSADAPIIVAPAGSSAGFALPPPAAAAPVAPATAPGPVLDAARIRTTIAETAALHGVLASIFDSADTVDSASSAAASAPSITPAAPAAGRAAPDGYAILGLDAAHSALLRYLTSCPEWRREKVAQLTQALGLLPQGALETINEAAFTAFGEAVLEGDEVVEVRTDLLEGMLHG